EFVQKQRHSPPESSQYGMQWNPCLQTSYANLIHVDAKPKEE
ncbi:unnamed protein product, partial [Musa textilis]